VINLGENNMKFWGSKRKGVDKFITFVIICSMLV
jgi:hypothetical protein